MKFCQQCGQSLNDDVQFCTACGAQVASAPAQPAYSASVSNSAQPNAYAQSNTYAQPNAYAQPNVVYTSQPVGQLKTNRGLIKLILLSLITLGIYSIVYYSSISNDINIIASRYDGKKTMHFCLLFFIVSPITLGIGAIVWYHKISARIGSELARRGIGYSFGAGSFWLWNVLGSFILVGPFIYIHKLSKAMNLLAENYNVRG